MADLEENRDTGRNVEPLRPNPPDPTCPLLENDSRSTPPDQTTPLRPSTLKCVRLIGDLVRGRHYGQRR